MEESRVGFKIETGAEDVDIKHEPLEPYVEYPVSLYTMILFIFYCKQHIFENFLKIHLCAIINLQFLKYNFSIFYP